MVEHEDLIISKQKNDNGEDNIIIMKNDKMIYCGVIDSKGDVAYVMGQIIDFFDVEY